MSVPETEFLTVAAVARRIGVAPATLRTWDRRYGLGPSRHASGSHRRYSELDVSRLTLMRKLISTGVAPADAALTAVALKEKSGVSKEVRRKVTKAIDSPDILIATLMRAARALDSALVQEIVSTQIKKVGVATCWRELISPLLIQIGENWEKSNGDIEVEHMLSEVLQRTLRVSQEPLSKPINTRPVLLACPGEELHTLPLHALAAALSEQNIEVHFLGARTPISALAALVKRAAPPAVFLWATMASNGDHKIVSALPKIRPTPRILLGGPGWQVENCKAATFVTDLDHACSEITRAVGA
ncbi:MAG: MerR family transcriptional regulator [Actinobacteria bacterium]|nr:MerR family transcriptional regulator [Actinomycetota bacterium]MTA46019.1 MerR family transcriptional regulator [Actinomycetota bacterium]